MNQEEQGKNMRRIVAKAWMDEGFKQRLLADPAAVLKEEGVETPPGIEVRVVANTETVFHFVLPVRPSRELSDEKLDSVSGGMTIDELIAAMGNSSDIDSVYQAAMNFFGSLPQGAPSNAPHNPVTDRRILR
jgi:hypothetical protein